MHVELGGYHVRDIEFSAAFDVSADKVGQDLAEAIFARRRTTPTASPMCRATGVAVRRGPTLDGLGKYLREMITEGATAPATMSPRSLRRRSAPTCSSATCPVGSQQATRVVRRAGARGRLRLRQLHPGVHRLATPDWRSRFEDARAADHRRRHQEPGRRDDRPPRAGQPVPRARRAARPHLPAQLRRQHRLPEHARARAAGVEEDLEDPGRHEPARTCRCRRATSMSARATTCRG